MTRFCTIYTGRPLGHTMKSTSFPISDAWLIKVAAYVILTHRFQNENGKTIQNRRKKRFTIGVQSCKI